MPVSSPPFVPTVHGKTLAKAPGVRQGMPDKCVIEFVRRRNKLVKPTILNGEGPKAVPLDEVDLFVSDVAVTTRQRLRRYRVCGPLGHEGVQLVDSVPIDGPRCSHFEEVHDVLVVGWVVTAGFALHWVFGANAAQVPVADLNRVLLEVSLLVVGASGCPFVDGP